MAGTGVRKEKATEKGRIYARCPGCAWPLEFRCVARGRPPSPTVETRALGDPSSLAWVLNLSFCFRAPCLSCGLTFSPGQKLRSSAPQSLGNTADAECELM